jgi:hypothetical protein
LFPLYWAYEHYLRETKSFIIDEASLLDSDHVVIAGLREFTGKHGLIRCKVVIQSRHISRVDTLGNIILHDLLFLYKAHVAFFYIFLFLRLILPYFFFSAAIMSGYAQLMKKTDSMTKKGKKESHAQSLARELTTDHGVQSLGASQGPSATAEDVVATSPNVQVAKKRKLILRNRQRSSAPASQELETIEAASPNEISVSDEEAKTVGEAFHRKRG